MTCSWLSIVRSDLQQSRPDLRPAESAREVAPAGRMVGTCEGFEPSPLESETEEDQ